MGYAGARDGPSTTAEAAKVTAMLQKPQEPLSRAHVTNVDNIILTVLQKNAQQQVGTWTLLVGFGLFVIASLIPCKQVIRPCI